MNDGDPTWRAFRSTSLTVALPTGALDVVPDAVHVRGVFLDGVTCPVHVVTAWNPRGIASARGANDEAHRRLVGEVSAMPGVATWPTTGTSQDGTWHEEGLTIVGLTRVEAITLATRYDQRAIFEWADEPGGFRLVACDGSADEARGWRSRLVG